MKAFIIRGLERPIVCQVQTDDMTFEIQCILHTYGTDATKWAAEPSTIKMLECSKELRFFDEQEHVFCQPVIFQKVLEYCSSIAATCSIGMSFVIHKFVNKEGTLQWFEQELDFVFHGETPRNPPSGEVERLKLIIARLKGERKILKRTRERPMETAAKILKESRNHIIIVPVERDEESDDEE